jgi:hypothetical protein
MPRLVPFTLLLALFLAGCGTGGDPSGKSGSADGPSPSASPTATYLVRADTDAINKVAARAQKRGTVAQNAKRIDACDARSSAGYPAWRRCWHGLAGPFGTSLDAMAGTLTDLSARDFTPSCKEELRRAAATFAARAKAVERLLQGIDSDQRAQQERSMRTYVPSLQKMARKWAEPFQALTQACYSPKDLESINASPSATPSG